MTRRLEQRQRINEQAEEEEILDLAELSAVETRDSRDAEQPELRFKMEELSLEDFSEEERREATQAVKEMSSALTRLRKFFSPSPEESQEITDRLNEQFDQTVSKHLQPLVEFISERSTRMQKTREGKGIYRTSEKTTVELTAIGKLAVIATDIREGMIKSLADPKFRKILIVGLLLGLGLPTYVGIEKIRGNNLVHDFAQMIDEAFDNNRSKTKSPVFE